MKRSFFLLIMLCIALSAVGQNKPTLRAIIFADTYDEKIGDGADVSKEKFDEFLNTVAQIIGYDYKCLFGAGGECSRESLMRTLDKFSCDTADIVVFCYLGHGGRSKEDTSVFPQMCLHEKYQKNYVPVEYVKNRLADHGARVTWVIGDCCNSFGEFIKPKPLEGPTILKGATVPPEILIKNLFLNFTGVITMCASKPGTYGWSNNVTGMYFNNSLIRAIQKNNLNNMIPGQPWKSVMNSVLVEFRNRPPFIDREDPSQTPHKMEPQYRIEPRRVFKGEVPPIPPEPTSLQKLLSKLADGNRESVDRMRDISSIQQKYFAQNVIVRTVSSDNIAYGTPYSIDKYLRHLAYADNIVNVVIRRSKVDDTGKVIYLEIHEIYSELKK